MSMLSVDDFIDEEKLLMLSKSLRLISDDLPKLSVRNLYFHDLSYTLSVSVSYLLAIVLDDTIDQLLTMSEGFIYNDTLEFEDLEDRAARFFIDDPVFDPDTGDLFDKTLQTMKTKKLFIDSAKMMTLLINVKNELKEKNTYTCLVQFIKKFQYTRTEEEDLLIEEKDNLDILIQLKQTLASESRDNLKLLHSLNEKIATMKDKTEQTLFDNLLRIRSIKHWEAARSEQGKLICDQQINKLETTINSCKNKIDKETRVNSEIEMFLQSNQKEMEDSIEEWMEKYEKDSENRIVDIQILKEKREDLEKSYAELVKVYEDHKQQIEDYLLYKEEARIEEERIAFLSEKAIKIQAWWRGVMVRRQLGPYNPRKGKKGKGKGKGKDKKKKKK